MKTNLYFAAFLLLVSVSFISCSTLNLDSLQIATAKEIGNTKTEDVNIYDIDRGATAVHWKAKSPSGCYECDADLEGKTVKSVRNVNCVNVECDSLGREK